LLGYEWSLKVEERKTKNPSPRKAGAREHEKTCHLESNQIGLRIDTADRASILSARHGHDGQQWRKETSFRLRCSITA